MEFSRTGELHAVFAMYRSGLIDSSRLNEEMKNLGVPPRLPLLQSFLEAHARDHPSIADKAGFVASVLKSYEDHLAPRKHP